MAQKNEATSFTRILKKAPIYLYDPVSVTLQEHFMEQRRRTLLRACSGHLKARLQRLYSTSN